MAVYKPTLRLNSYQDYVEILNKNSLIIINKMWQEIVDSFDLKIHSDHALKYVFVLKVAVHTNDMLFFNFLEQPSPPPPSPTETI